MSKTILLWEAMKLAKEGKDIQWRDRRQDANTPARWLEFCPPTKASWRYDDDDFFEFRLKPREPKEIWVNEYVDGSCFGHKTEDGARAGSIFLGEKLKRRAVKYREVIEDEE